MTTTNFTTEQLMELIGCDETWLIENLKSVGIIENGQLYFTTTPEIVLTAVATYHMKEYEDHLLSLN